MTSDELRNFSIEELDGAVGRLKGFRGVVDWIERGETQRGLRVLSVQGRFEQPMQWPLVRDAEWIDVCLNFNGRGRIEMRGGQVTLEAGMIWVRWPRDGGVGFWRGTKTLHRFVHVWISRTFVERWGTLDARVKEAWMRRWEKGPAPGEGWDETQLSPIPTSFLGWQSRLLTPPVPLSLRGMWLEGKTVELLSTLMASFVGMDSLFCERLRHDSVERIERVRRLLERDLENPPGLRDLAREVKWSPFHLSRQFKRETGFSLPQYLRRLRMERAAALLAEGKYQVTEVAMLVGYSSLSAFNKAFVEAHGVCPGLYSCVPLVQKGRLRSRSFSEGDRAIEI